MGTQNMSDGSQSTEGLRRGLLNVTCAHKPVSKKDGGGVTAEACSKLGFQVCLNYKLLHQIHPVRWDRKQPKSRTFYHHPGMVTEEVWRA